MGSSQGGFKMRRYLEKHFRKYKKRIEKGKYRYGITDKWLLMAIKKYGVGDTLVYGSTGPYYEQMVLMNGGFPTIVEYEKIKVKYKNIRCLTIEECNAEPGGYHSALAISTFEHTGLGRYGDPIDPDGDLKAMKAVAKKTDLLYLSVPYGEDGIDGDLHRIYGDRFEKLVEGWGILESFGMDYKTDKLLQPVWVLGK